MALTVETSSPRRCPARHRRVQTLLEWQRHRYVTRLGTVVHDVQHGTSPKPATPSFPSAVAAPAMVQQGRLQGCVRLALHDLPSISGAMTTRKPELLGDLGTSAESAVSVITKLFAKSTGARYVIVNI